MSKNPVTIDPTKFPYKKAGIVVGSIIGSITTETLGNDCLPFYRTIPEANQCVLSRYQTTPILGAILTADGLDSHSRFFKIVKHKIPYGVLLPCEILPI